MNIRKIFWVILMVLVFNFLFGSVALSEEKKAMVVPCGQPITFYVSEKTIQVATLTYYQPDKNIFGAVGHGIYDQNNSLIDLSGKTVNQAEVDKIEKNDDGVKHLDSHTLEKKIVGSIICNTPIGIFGKYNLVNKLAKSRQAIPVANIDEICIGKASILCTLEGTEPKEYEVEIQGYAYSEMQKMYGFAIKITDPDFIEKAGEIVSGMSGSPIIQNGLFVGALSIKVQEDPTQGFAIFGLGMVQ
jgi:stage IV sporulation protein B